LTGKQGVLIPAANVRHLILRQDVVQAVADGKFHIYPVRAIDDGLAILAGGPAEDAGDGRNINKRVGNRLKELALGLREFTGPVREGITEEKTRQDLASVV
ncbi:MAG TPA: ATP-dependent protease, partial [Candidatus Binatia bacterium]|nr:ATP-dependent protease [Candidatus Binatia bacterium]